MSHYSDGRRKGEDSSRTSRHDRDLSPGRAPKTAEEPDSAMSKAAAAAAAAAARINAMVGARPPVETTAIVNPPPPNAKSDGYSQEGDFIKDIEINDLRNRYLLTKGQTQLDIKKATGSDVTTRGKFFPDKSMATERDVPLYLHITSTSQSGLDEAVKMVNDLIEKDLGPLVDERRFKRERKEEVVVDRDEYGRRKWPEKKVLVGLDPVRGFNIRAQVVGQQGAFVKHIAQETKTRVQIKGRGSGYVEQATGRESDEPMYLHITGPEAQDIDAAAVMVEDLLNTVRENYEAHKSQPPDQPLRFPGYQGQGAQVYNPVPYGSAAAQPNVPGQTSASPPGVAASSYQQSGAQQQQPQQSQQDPYAAYGGYQNYMAYYAAYYQQQQQAQAGQPAGGIPGQQAQGGYPQQAYGAPPGSGQSPPPPGY